MTSLEPLKLGLLVMWTAWFSLVVFTNAFDALKMLGVLPQRWRFASQNFQQLRDAVAVYSAPSWLAGVLYAGVIAWQLVIAAFMWRALLASAAAGQLALAAIDAAFFLALGLWAAFLLAEEIFKQYQTESKHILLFMAQLLTLSALHLLPD